MGKVRDVLPMVPKIMQLLEKGYNPHVVSFAISCYMQANMLVPAWLSQLAQPDKQSENAK